MAKSFKLRALLWYYNNMVKYDLNKMTAQEFRKFADKENNSILDGRAKKVGKITDLSVQGRNGVIPIRLYSPTQTKDAPVIVYFHGGGFVIGNLETHDKTCRRLCHDNNSFVVSVDYRLAPEHKFPAAPEDCYDATKWASENISQYGGNPDKLVVMGDSAGGNLATVTAIQARDLNGPKIAAQVLIYPTVDGHMKSPSIEENGTGHILTAELMNWFLNNYLNDEADKDHPLVSPILTNNLSNLPPALVQTAQFDPLRDEGIAFAQKLKAAGNQVQHTNYEGLIHTYFTMAGFSKKCGKTHEEVATFLKKKLISSSI